MKLFTLLLLLSLSQLSANSYSTSSNWLLETQGDEKKFKAIQTQFRGFDLAMVEVGYRFNTFYFAIQDKNYDLAHYQLDKIKKSIENGIHRRPKREENSKNMFLNTQYKMMKKALKTENEKKIWKEYETTKQVCNSCHKAERVPFIKVIDPKYRWQPIR
jgi:ATP-dependent Lon protease